MHTNSDFDGDGRSDILLRERGGGPTHILYATAADGFAPGLTFNWPSSWTIVANGDFNGDGREDILLSQGFSDVQSTPLLSMLQTVSAGFQPDWEAAVMMPAGWMVTGTGDFNGDGKTDLLLRNTDGRMTTWLVGPPDATIVDVPDAPFVPSATFSIVASSDWHVIATSDFNGDGRTDLLWRSSGGTITNWLADQSGSFSHNWNNFSVVASSSWQIIGTGDFNGDGRDDLLWRNDNGAITNWLADADGGFSDNWASFNIVATSDWQIVGTGDYNGDGHDDLLWRNEAGLVTDWLGTPSGSFVDNWLNAATLVATNWLVQPNPSGAGEWDY